MTALPKRSWFSFSLRTLFVVVTLLAIPFGWLALQVQIVRERKAVLQEFWRSWRPDAGFDYFALETNEATIGTSKILDFIRVSRLRRILGDETCIRLAVGPGLSLSWLKRMEIAFPEAELAICDAKVNVIATRDSLYGTKPNTGAIFKTGLIEK